MSAPNEFVPPVSHTFHHEGVAPLIIQPAHTTGNFSAAPNANGAGTHFNGGGFFTNSVGYDMAMLPLFHHTSQRPAAHYNAPSFAHQKPHSDNMVKEDMGQIPSVDGRSNVFNSDTSYWSRQSQLSPFGVLPHEISPDHIEAETKSPYENVLNTAHYADNLGGHLTSAEHCVINNRDKKAQVIVPGGKSKESSNAKKASLYIHKSANEIGKLNSNTVPSNSPVYRHEDMAYRNGVINRGAHSMDKVDHASKMMHLNYKNPTSKTHNGGMDSLHVNDSSSSSSPVNTIPRDYRVFKSPPVFANAPVPVVKFTGKSAAKQFPQKQMMNKTQNSAPQMAKNQRINPGSPLIQKMSEYQDEAQSSPMSLTSGDPNGRIYSLHADTMKKSEAEPSYHALNHLSHPLPQPAANYRDQQQMQEMNCHNQDKNKVTPSFLKLPYSTTTTNMQSEIIPENRRNSFDPLYAMYNQPPPLEKTSSRLLQDKLNERVPEVNNLKLPASIPHSVDNSQTATNHMLMSKQPNLQNGLVVYSSVIMRTDRNYEVEDKLDKSTRPMMWPRDERHVSAAALPSMKPEKANYNSKNQSQVQSSASGHHLLLGLTERQHSYFDTSSCPPHQQLQQNPNIKCNQKSLPKNVYDESPPQHPIPQSQDQMHHYTQQQYLQQPTNNSNVTKNQVPTPQQPSLKEQSPQPSHDVMDKSSYARKRKQSKTNNAPLMGENARLPEYNREPPPAHVNLYQQPLQNTSYMMDNSRYDLSGGHTAMPKMYPNTEQFYASPQQQQQQSNLNAYNMVNTPHETNHQQTSVIPTHATTTPHLSPSNSASASPHHIRQMTPVPSTLPLSAYFSNFHPNNNSPYPHHEYPVPSTTPSDTPLIPTQPYMAPLQPQPPLPPPPPPSTTSDMFPVEYNPSTPKLENEPYEERVKVIVPDVEEEFKFLFDPSLPNYRQIACITEEEELFRKTSARAKPMFYRKNIDFLASYIKFLENNCESVETLTDANSGNMKTWNRTRTVYQPAPPIRDDASEKSSSAVATPPPPPEPVKEPECNFENDPRYYPLPKSSDKRRLDSSSDESSEDEFPKKCKSAVTAGSKSATSSDGEKKKVVSKKKLKSEKRKAKHAEKKEGKDVKPKEERTLKERLEKLEKAKQKIAKLKLKAEKKKHKAEKIRPKMEKVIAEMKAIKESAVIIKRQKKCAAPKEKEQPVQRRKVAERKAKDDFILKQTIHEVIESDDEPRSDSDSDPSWTPRADDDENTSMRRNTRMRSVRFKTRNSRRIDSASFRRHFSSDSDDIRDDFDDVHEAGGVKGVKSLEYANTTGPFYILKKDANAKHPNLWRLHDGSRLQKYERFEHDGRHLYRNLFEYSRFSDSDKNKYQEVDVNLVEEKNDRLVVELCDETDIPTDLKIKENFMKESLCYEHQFAVYIQTLVSQALDSNFLNEIVKENDVYFLNNMKVVDEVTATYLNDLTNVVKWDNKSVNILVKTWPFVSVNKRETFKNSTANNSVCECASCDETNEARQTAIFYGQPYQRETLQGCKPNSNIPNDMDKMINLCNCCAREVKLFNKIWHQKYHIFVECAKYVSKKKTENRCKGTTDILNELLADTAWLSKLFYDIRNTWLQIWTVVQKTKETQSES